MQRSERNALGQLSIRKCRRDAFDLPTSAVADSSEFDRNGLTTGFSLRALRGRWEPAVHKRQAAVFLCTLVPAIAAIRGEDEMTEPMEAKTARAAASR